MRANAPWQKRSIFSSTFKVSISKPTDIDRYIDRYIEVTNHCIMVDILAFVVFTAPGSHTPPSDIQAGPLGHTGRPDIQSDLLSDSRASLTVSPQIQPIQPECSDQARSGAG
jgi:hypothetical protein